LKRADYVQLPVVPEMQRDGRWIGGHYGDEFAENHLKTLVVRDWLGTSLPAAGVGCAFRRGLLVDIAQFRGGRAPFVREALTEDYELGLLVSELGGRSRFVRATDPAGHLIATRECFPHRLEAAIRQKARWVHGIAFQGWERIGWGRRPAEIWMRVRDRRGPLVVIVLLAAYAQIPLWGALMLGDALGLHRPRPLGPMLLAVTVLGLTGLVWRLLTRFAFTTAQYGWREGLRSAPRQLLGNVITILAGGRAFASYCESLRGRDVAWDKTHHERHPASLASASE
jgi:adsorption protein B